MAEEILEQAEGTIETEAPVAQDNLESIFSDALKEKGGTPEDAVQADEKEPESETQDQAEKSEAEKLYGELVYGETQKIPFKSEEDFKKFMESNQLLKDGYMRLQDYTRKTQEVAETRKKFEREFAEREQADLETWGGEKPDPDSLKSLADIWTVFRHAPANITQAINAFVSDIQLIASGRTPVGPLSDVNGQFNPQDSQIIELRKEMDKIRRESATQGKRWEAEQQEAALERATGMLSSWEGRMKSQGITIEREEYEEMAKFGHLIGKPKANGETYSFDDAYRAALALLGKSDKLAVKKIIAKSNEVKKKTPATPTARASSGSQPVAKDTLDAIFSEGMRQLKE
jgi:hypothetical protein